MKKLTIISILIILLLLVPTFTVNAETLGNLKSKLASEKAAKDAANQKKYNTQKQIDSSNASVNNKQTEITNNNKKIEDSKKQIDNLNNEIAETKDKIKKVLVDEEISSSDNAYLEYIFGATSISDFIIRVSIGKQVTDYSHTLIGEYEGKIKENEKLQDDLAKREVELNNQIADLEKQISSLGEDLSKYNEESVSHDEEIKALEERIKYYTSLGCKDNQQLSSCVNYSNVMNASGFIRPITKAVVTSEYGWRLHPTLGYSRLHGGIDLGTAEGQAVYPAAAGKVTVIINKGSCGGNQVYITHNINGKKYTTVYMHLLSYTVSSSQDVTTNTIIGYSGGASTYWDRCSTGGHLHFGIASGWYCDDKSICYTTYSGWANRSFNPRQILNFPSSFSTRS